jgi:hypothetical protein
MYPLFKRLEISLSCTIIHQVFSLVGTTVNVFKYIVCYKFLHYVIYDDIVSYIVTKYICY